jgi:hypothetical protein
MGCGALRPAAPQTRFSSVAKRFIEEHDTAQPAGARIDDGIR